MTKAALISGAVALLGTLLFTSLGFGIAGPCCALVAGLGAGYLTGVWDKPGANNLAVRRGAQSGAIGGIGAVVGHLGGAAILLLTQGELIAQTSQQLVEGLGLPSGGDVTSIYFGAVLGQCCFGLLGVALMAGLGALGGVLWWQMTGKNQAGGGTAYTG